MDIKKFFVASVGFYILNFLLLYIYQPSYGRGARNLRGVSPLLCSNSEINLKLSSRAPFWPMVRSSSQLHNNPSSEQAVDF